MVHSSLCPAYFTGPDVFKAYLYWGLYQNFLLCKSDWCSTVWRGYIWFVHHLQMDVCLLAPLGSCESCCRELGMQISLRFCFQFFWTGIQNWDSWIMWLFYFWCFEEPACSSPQDVPFSIPASSTQVFPFLHTAPSACSDHI